MHWADAGCRLVTSAAAITFAGVHPSSSNAQDGDVRMRKKPLELQQWYFVGTNYY